jgi:PAS domain S-box-containing protein
LALVAQTIYEQCFQLLSDGLIIITPDETIQDINAAALKIFGYNDLKEGSLDTPVGKKITILIPDHTCITCSIPFKELFKKEGTPSNPNLLQTPEIEHLYRAKTSSGAFLEIIITFSKSFDGKLLIAKIENTTIKSHTKKIMKVVHKILGLTNYLIFFEVDDKGKLIWLSDNFEESMGYKKDEWIGKNAVDLLEAKSKAFILSFFKPGSSKPQFPKPPQTYHVQWVKKDGSLLNLRVIGATVDNLNVMHLAINIDAEEQKRLLEVGIRESQADQFKLVNKTLSCLSHDLRTPTHGIGLLLKQLRDSVTAKELKFSFFEDKILKNIEIFLFDMNWSLDEFVTLINLDSKTCALIPDNFNLNIFFTEIARFISQYIEKKEIELSILLDPQIPINIFSDKEKLKSIILNICKNATDFTNNGKIEILLTLDEKSKQILLRHEKLEEFELTITINDTGIGIDKKYHQMIFEKFSYLPNPAYPSRKGLGLYISSKIADLLCAKLKLEKSELNIGSSFSITIPVKTAKTQDFPVIKLQKPSVLVAEDNELNRRLLIALATKNGCRCTSARDGQEALEKLKKEAFDFVLMDIQMPIKDGLQATEEWREIEKHKSLRRTPIIAVSAVLKDAEKERECQKAGMDSLVSKPCDWETIKKSLKSLGFEITEKK